MRVLGPTWLASALLLIAPSASARHAVRFEWSRGDDSCIEPSALRAAVEDTLGHPLGQKGPPSISGSVEHLSTGEWQATIVGLALDGTRKERRLAAKTCKELDSALVIVIATMVDELEEIEPPPTPPPPPPPPRKVRPLKVTTPGRVWVEATLGVGVDAGLLPSPSPYVELGASLRGAQWLAGLRLLSHQHQSRFIGNVGGDFAATSARWHGCRAFDDARLSLRPCPEVGFTVLTASPLNLTQGNVRSQLVVTGGFSITAAVRVLGPLWIGVYGGADLVLRRNRVAYLNGTNLEELHVPGPVVTSAGLRLELRP